MKVTIKLSIFLMIFASFSCSLNTENENILSQDTANTTDNLLKSASTNSVVNTIAIRNVAREIGKQPLFMVSFGSENLAERKGWDGSVKGKRNFVIDHSGTILTELSPEEVAPGNPAFKPGTPIGGIIVKGGKNPGGQMTQMETDGKGEIVLPDEWIEGEYLIQIQIESKTQISEFILKIGKEKIAGINALNMLVNKNGTIRNFFYERDFQLHSDIAKYFGVEEIIIAKGFYPVDYSDKEEGGSVSLKVKNKGVVKGAINVGVINRLFEGTNPKGIDCKGFGTACFYFAERGIDKKDIRYYVVKPIINKEKILIGVKISEGKKGLNAVNVKKGITQSGVK